MDLVKEINDIISYHFSQKLSDKGITIDFINNSLGEQYEVYSDKLILNQILINLIDNAIKYFKPDGNITIIIEEKEKIFNLQSYKEEQKQRDEKD